MTSRTRATLWVLFIFLVGGFFGSVLSYLLTQPARFYTSDQSHVRQPLREPGHPRRNFSKFLQHLDKSLNLDQEQEAQVRQILEETRNLFRNAAENAHRTHKEIRTQARNRIRSFLKPDQIEKYEKMVRLEDQRPREGRRHRPRPL